MASSRKRFMKIAGMTASITGKVAKNSLKHLSRDEEKRLQARKQMMKDIGVQIADTLGEMKGAVMKVGQIASQYKDVFPPEVSQALEKLQRDVPPMSFTVIKQQVEQELGKPIEELFDSFDEVSFASASIGQVHKAILKDSGQSVVVKVQYPDIEKNIDSDLNQIRLALRLTGVLNMSRELQNQIFTEIKDSLKEELNYFQEAKNIVKFADFHANDEGIVIPKVIDGYSSRRVLTLTCEMGESLDIAKTWDNTVKQKIARSLFRFSAGQLFNLNALHCDPHPGNFAFLPDGRLIAYDFGGIKTYSEDEVALFRQFVGHAIKLDATALEQDLVKIGTRISSDTDGWEEINGDFYLQWIAVAMKGLSEEFDFANSTIHKETVTQMKSSLKYYNQFRPSPLTMMLDRTVTGQYWNLVNLGVTVDLSDLLDEYCG